MLKLYLISIADRASIGLTLLIIVSIIFLIVSLINYLAETDTLRKGEKVDKRTSNMLLGSVISLFTVIILLVIVPSEEAIHYMYNENSNITNKEVVNNTKQDSITQNDTIRY